MFIKCSASFCWALSCLEISCLHRACGIFFPSCLLHLRSSRQKAGTSCLGVAPPSLHTRSSNIPVFCWEFLILLDPDLDYFFDPQLRVHLYPPLREINSAT